MQLVFTAAGAIIAPLSGTANVSFAGLGAITFPPVVVRLPIYRLLTLGGGTPNSTPTISIPDAQAQPISRIVTQSGNANSTPAPSSIPDAQAQPIGRITTRGGS